MPTGLVFSVVRDPRNSKLNFKIKTLFDELKKEFVCCDVHPITAIACEMASPILLRLGVPIDKIDSYLHFDTALPCNTSLPTKTNISSYKYIDAAMGLLSMMCVEEQNLICSTIDLGIPRIVETTLDYLPLYRCIGFTTFELIIQGEVLIYTIVNSDSSFNFSSNKKIIDYIRVNNLLTPKTD